MIGEGKKKGGKKEEEEKKKDGASGDVQGLQGGVLFWKKKSQTGVCEPHLE